MARQIVERDDRGNGRGEVLPDPVQFTSAAGWKCRRLMGRTRKGGDVSAEDMLEVAAGAAREIDRGNASILEVLQIYGFLITTRVHFGRWDARMQDSWDLDRNPEPPTLPSIQFDRAIDSIGTYLGERIHRNGSFMDPFSGQFTTGQNLRNRLYQRTQHHGHPGTAIAFA